MLRHRRVGRAQVDAHARARRPALFRAAGAAASLATVLGDRRADRRRRLREPPAAGEPLLLRVGLGSGLGSGLG